MPTPTTDDWPRSILRCPACRSELVDGTGPDGPELQCADTTDGSCGRAYRIDDGVPVLLVHEARLTRD